MGKINFSIIVPTYNRVEKLKMCLDSILSIDYPKSKYELIVINDGSMDNTPNFLKHLSDKIRWKNFIFFNQKNGGPAVARNTGIKHSSGKIIIFIDDDCIVQKSLIQLHKKYYNDPSVGGVGGNQLPKNLSFEDVYWIARYLHEFEGVRRVVDPKLGEGLITANCSYRKKIFNEVGLFDEDFPIAAGEDVEFSRRVLEKGYALIRDSKILNVHLRGESFFSTIRLKFKRMSGAVVDDNKRDFKMSNQNNIKRIITQWKNFKYAYKKWIGKKIGFGQFLRFWALSICLYVAAITGRTYFKIKYGIK